MYIRAGCTVYVNCHIVSTNAANRSPAGTSTANLYVKVARLCDRAEALLRTFEVGLRVAAVDCPPAPLPAASSWQDPGGGANAFPGALGRCVAALVDGNECVIEEAAARHEILRLFSSWRKQELQGSARQAGAVGVSIAVLTQACDSHRETRVYGSFNSVDGMRLAAVLPQ